MKKTMKTLLRKRVVFAGVLALTVFGAVYGFAATLNVGSNALSAGNATVASCQASGTPTGTYQLAYDSTLGNYKISGVTVSNLDTNCAGKSISVTLTGTSNSNLTTLTGTVPVGGGSLALPTSSTVAASAVSGIDVAIAG